MSHDDAFGVDPRSLGKGGAREVDGGKSALSVFSFQIFRIAPQPKAVAETCDSSIPVNRDVLLTSTGVSLRIAILAAHGPSLAMIPL
jgi:hypothetical protein